MDQKTATITVHSSNRLLPDWSMMDDRSIVKADTTVSLRIPVGQSIRATLADLSIKLEQAAIALVNGRTQDLDYVLQDEDTVVLLEQISGG